MSIFPEHELPSDGRPRSGENSAAERAAARRTVARKARDVHDCALLFDALGLVPRGMRLKVEVKLP